MCYYNYVTLSRCMMNVFMFWIVLGGVGSVLSIFTIGLSGLVNMIIFPLQLALMVLTGYILWFKIGKYIAAKKVHDRETKKGGPVSEQPNDGYDMKAKIDVNGVDVPVKIHGGKDGNIQIKV